MERSNERNIKIEYITKCLTNLTPLGITKTRENRFKLIYPHKQASEDLYIVIEIDDYQEIEIITIYTFNIYRRLREYAI